MHAHAALSLCLGLALASSSLATVTANRYDSTGTLIASHTWTPSIPQEFEITVGSSDATVYIFQSNVNDDIPLLKLKQTSGSTSNAIQVYVA